MKTVYRTIHFCILFLAAFATYSQSNERGSWNILSLKMNLDRKWSLLGGADRSQLLFDDFSYYELKGGASFAFKKNFSALIGGGRYVTYSNGDNFKKPFINQEWRTWEQLAMSTNLDRLRIEHRYRIEQRWTSNAGYRNRFRYRIAAVLPLNAPKVEPKAFYITAADEIFLTNSDPHLERNRLYGSIGYQFTSHFATQLGYLLQTDYKLDFTHSNKGYLHLSFMVEIDAHNKHHEKETSTNHTD